MYSISVLFRYAKLIIYLVTLLIFTGKIMRLKRLKKIHNIYIIMRLIRLKKDTQHLYNYETLKSDACWLEKRLKLIIVLP